MRKACEHIRRAFQIKCMECEMQGSVISGSLTCNFFLKASLYYNYDMSSVHIKERGIDRVLGELMEFIFFFF